MTLGELTKYLRTHLSGDTRWTVAPSRWYDEDLDTYPRVIVSAISDAPADEGLTTVGEVTVIVLSRLTVGKTDVDALATAELVRGLIAPGGAPTAHTIDGCRVIVEDRGLSVHVADTQSDLLAIEINVVAQWRRKSGRRY